MNGPRNLSRICFLFDDSAAIIEMWADRSPQAQGIYLCCDTVSWSKSARSPTRRTAAWWRGPANPQGRRVVQNSPMSELSAYTESGKIASQHA
jgi:hypothetical protein